MYAGAGRADGARELLQEMERVPNRREHPVYPVYLPDAVRLAVGLGELRLAERLADGVDTVYSYAQHSVRTARAALAEARGETEEAAGLYSEAADRWERFGVEPERAYALLGRARCLVALGRGTDAVEPLREARPLFEALGARPALDEAGALLARTAAPAS